MGSVTTTVTLLWETARYAVRWAHGPEEVPAFDPSRGGDPFINGAWQTSVGQELSFLPASRGGEAAAPAIEYPLQIDVDDTGASGEASYYIPVPNYPRLVRVTTADASEPIQHRSPVYEIAGLVSSTTEEKFMGACRLTMERFGPLGFGTFDFTLMAWKHAAIELNTHLKLLEILRDAADYGGDGESLDGEDRRLLQEALDGLEPELARPSVGEMRRTIERASSVEQLREELARRYWATFQHNCMERSHPGPLFHQPSRPTWGQPSLVEVGPAPGQVRVRTGCRGWAFQELWGIASQGRRVHQCATCGRLYPASRRDSRYCSNACKMKYHRRRQPPDG